MTTPNITATATPIAGVMVLASNSHVDHRGSFMRLFCAQEMEALGLDSTIGQINQSRTMQVGAIRGMHFQRPPGAEAKYIRCIRGSIFDVAVDLREGSPTFMHWHGVELNEEDSNCLYLPPGVAHGFQVLTPKSELLYLHSGFYDPSIEDGIAHNDPAIGITWPLPVTDISERDTCFPPIDDNFQGVTI